MRFDDIYQQVGPSIEGPMPLLIVTDGWLEASDTLARVRECIRQQADLTTVAQFDTDQLLDQRARRPTLHVKDGVTQGVDWPELELAVGTDQDDKPFLILHGPEPDFAWRQFGKAVANIVSAIGVTTTFSMGAYPAPMPHTRPVRISSTASDAEMIVNREHTTGLISVPVGVQVAITEELERFGVPSHGLYAQVPYYLASTGVAPGGHQHAGDLRRARWPALRRQPTASPGRRSGCRRRRDHRRVTQASTTSSLGSNSATTS